LPFVVFVFNGIEGMIHRAEEEEKQKSE